MFTFVNSAVNPPSYLKFIFYIIDLKRDFEIGSAVRLVERGVGGRGVCYGCQFSPANAWR